MFMLVNFILLLNAHFGSSSRDEGFSGVLVFAPSDALKHWSLPTALYRLENFCINCGGNVLKVRLLNYWSIYWTAWKQKGGGAAEGLLTSVHSPSLTLTMLFAPTSFFFSFI